VTSRRVARRDYRYTRRAVRRATAGRPGIDTVRKVFSFVIGYSGDERNGTVRQFASKAVRREPGRRLSYAEASGTKVASGERVQFEVDCVEER
jgi:hypothetical protein